MGFHHRRFPVMSGVANILCERYMLVPGYTARQLKQIKCIYWEKVCLFLTT